VLSFGELGEVLAPTALRARIALRSAAASQTYATGVQHPADASALSRDSDARDTASAAVQFLPIATK
jgi:hypothetical protein